MSGAVDSAGPYEPLVEYLGYMPHRQALLGRCRRCREWWEMPALAPVRRATKEDVVAWLDVGDFEPNVDGDETASDNPGTPGLR